MQKNYKNFLRSCWFGIYKVMSSNLNKYVLSAYNKLLGNYKEKQQLFLKRMLGVLEPLVLICLKRPETIFLLATELAQLSRWTEWSWIQASLAEWALQVNAVCIIMQCSVVLLIILQKKWNIMLFFSGIGKQCFKWHSVLIHCVVMNANAKWSDQMLWLVKAGCLSLVSSNLMFLVTQ